jgi:hypothetical protein
MTILHYGAKIWGHEKAAQLECVQLGYFKDCMGCIGVFWSVMKNL